MKKIFLIALILLCAFVLRFYKLADFPVGLHSDETTYGYNAYSLLTTGYDEHYQYWPISLKSFGDYKPPMSSWLAIPSIWVFGLNEFAVRLPTALLGTLTVFTIFLLTKEVLLNIYNKPLGNRYNFIPFTAALLLTFSPWHILFSRASQLVGLEVFFLSTGVLFLLKGLRLSKYFYLSPLFFGAAIYTYYGSRVTVALLLVLFIIIFRNDLKNIKGRIGLGLIMGVIVLSPLFISIVKEPLTLTGRAKNLSVFYDPGIRLKLWESHTLDGSDYPIFLSRFFNNKPYFYLKNISERYLEHLSFTFLFTNGGVQAPFNIPRMGVAYLVEIIFFIVGLYYLIKTNSKYALFIIGYFLISPIASSFTFITPAANRSFNMVIPFVIISSFGIYELINYFKIHFNKFIFAVYTIGLSYIIFFAYFLYIYFVIMPIEIPHQWHYGRGQMVEAVSLIQDDYESVVASINMGPAYIWFLFYLQYDPAKYWVNSNIDLVPDNLGWIKVDGFDKYKFIKEFDWNEVEKKKDTLYVGFEDDIPLNWVGVINNEKLSVRVLEIIKYPNGLIAFTIVDLVEY